MTITFVLFSPRKTRKFTKCSGQIFQGAHSIQGQDIRVTRQNGKQGIYVGQKICAFDPKFFHDTPLHIPKIFLQLQIVNVFFQTVSNLLNNHFHRILIFRQFHVNSLKKNSFYRKTCLFQFFCQKSHKLSATHTLSVELYGRRNLGHSPFVIIWKNNHICNSCVFYTIVANCPKILKLWLLDFLRSTQVKLRWLF